MTPAAVEPDTAEPEALDVATHGDYTVAHVAEIFGRKPQTVRDWIKSGRMRGYLFNGREYRVTQAAIEEYRACQRNGTKGRRRTVRRGVANLAAWRRVS